MAAPMLPGQVVARMAKRQVRMHHLLWHEVRNGWLFYDDQTRRDLRALGWEPPRPARRPRPDGRPQVILDNFSGEDFLFMHRQMIAAVNEVLAAAGQPDYPRVKGWSPVPRPGDADYPVPPAWETGDAQFDAFLVKVKSDQEFEDSFVPWEQDYTDPARLRQWTLGELGARLEFTIHNQMHMRWSEESEMRPDADPTATTTIDTRWDDPSYDWLGDTYSSHVNHHFWKLHGWVDDRIEDWCRANDVEEIDWVGTWVGHMPHGHEHDPPDAVLGAEPGETRSMSSAARDDHSRNMDEALRVVAGTGWFHRLSEPVEVEPLVASG
ncbi:MAG: Tat pathway signal protein [Acidimicrobiia bacterium]